MMVLCGRRVAGAGIGSNVVQTLKTNVFTTSSTSFVDVTGLTVTITPSSDTSKVLILATVMADISGDTDGIYLQLSGGANTSSWIGDAGGSRTRALWGTRNTGNGAKNVGIAFVDSPATSSPVTYSLQAKVQSGTATGFINRAADDFDNGLRTRGASSIIAIEVAA
jgi:hypothetical protein